MTTTQHTAMARAIHALITKRREEAFAVIESRTAYEWNEHARCRIRVASWSDFGAYADLRGVTADTRITWERFRQLRDDSNCTVQMMVPFSELTPDD